MDHPALKYTTTVYEKKIQRLEALARDLETHLENLETKKSQVKEFWDDVQGEHYIGLITTQIIKVRDAIDQVNQLNITYKQILEDLNAASSVVSDQMDLAEQALKMVITLGAK